jgi:hypothetical protein
VLLKLVGTVIGSITGNAATATKLATARSITKATQDGSGNDIESTYATKAELSNHQLYNHSTFTIATRKEHFGRKQILTLSPLRL